MKKLSVLVSSFALGLFLTGTIQAQDETQESAAPANTEATSESSESKAAAPTDAEGFNKYSLRPIHESDIMYRKTILRAMDLREKQNKPMFSKNREITK